MKDVPCGQAALVGGFVPIRRYGKEVVSFFSARRKPGGGFGATPRLPATCEDTYYALRSLDVLAKHGVDVPPELFRGHGAFLSSKLRERLKGTRGLFYLAWSSAVAGRRDVLPAATDRILQEAAGRDARLEDAFYLGRSLDLQGPGGNPLPAPMPRVRQEEASLRTVRELWMYLWLAARGWIEAALPGQWAEWVCSCRNPDGGYGFMPGTTSYMENCYYALHCLDLLGRPFPDPQGTVAFISSSRALRGGFGRKNMGVPFPSSTWHALGCLHLVGTRGLCGCRT